MTSEQFASIRQYVGFDAESARALQRFHEFAAPHFERIVTDFYDAIEAHPEAAGSITGGRAQVDRLKKTLKVWLEDVLLGLHDEAYLDRHSRIGRVHVRIDLPQQFMFTAMNRIREHLLRIAVDHAPTDEATTTAINQILDLELAIMLDTYREDLVEKMRIRERLAALGQLSAMIAHELRNPLGTIESSLYLMRKRAEKLSLQDPVIAKHLEKISSQVQVCGATIRNLLALARDQPLQRRVINARDLLHSALASVTVPERVHVTVSAPEDLSISVDGDQIRTTLANLIGNAIQASQTTMNIALSAERRDGFVQLLIADDGPGVPPELRAKIFDVLFTTRASGTGLGLALARRICEAHGGSLELGPSDRGAVFRVILPENSGNAPSRAAFGSDGR